MALIGAQFVQAVDPNPVGSLQAFAGANAPTGWLLCNGAETAISAYPELYSVLSTTYGALTNGLGGAGSTHFRVPDMRGRVPVGAGSDSTAANNVSRTLGTKFGDTRLQSHSHTGTTGNMNSNNLHSPFVTSPGGHSWGANFGGLSGTATFTFSPSGVFAGMYGGTPLRTDQFDINHQHNITTNDHNQSIGTGANAPPSLGVNYIIKATSSIPRGGTALGNTPPIVTQLPANPQFGEVVTYVADATNGVYWDLQYDASGTYPWKFIGGAALRATGAGGTTSLTTPQTTGTPSLSVPLAGDYDCSYGCFTQAQTYATVFNASMALFKTTTAIEQLNFVPVGVYNGGNIAGNYRAAGLTASQALNLRYWVSGSSASFGTMFINTTPIRVSA